MPGEHEPTSDKLDKLYGKVRKKEKKENEAVKRRSSMREGERAFKCYYTRINYPFISSVSPWTDFQAATRHNRSAVTSLSLSAVKTHHFFFVIDSIGTYVKQ